MKLTLPASPEYLPYFDLGDRPNIIVDGAPLDSTVLTLSHWPNNRTPASVLRDTSTATTLAYLQTPDLHRDVPYVSNNHFDEDGLLSMFAVQAPQLACEHAELLAGAALAGDFGICTIPEAVRLCFVVEAFCDPSQSPLPGTTFEGCERQRVAALYRAMLERVPELLRDIGAWEALWCEPYAHLDESRRLIESGQVVIDEYPDVDLAVVRIPAKLPARPARRYLAAESAAVHPFAINSATTCNRIVRLHGERFDLQYRYESWVQFASRRPALRVSLDSLVEALNDAEQAPGVWRSEPADDVAPRMFLDGAPASSLGADEFIAMVRRELATAPVAWDPYDWEPAA